MAKDTDLGNTSPVTITSQKAQQIVQQYNAYKASGGQPAPASAPKPTPNPSGGPINISQAQLQRTNAVRAEQDLPPLQEVANVRVVQPTPSYPSGPQPDKIKSQPAQMADVLSAQKAQVKKTQGQINQLTSDFAAAKAAGVNEIKVKDVSGNVIGTVNPQNVSQARLQYLNLTKKGAVSYEYQTVTKEAQNQVTSSLTTYKPSNVITAFTGGALGGFAELGLIGLGLVAKATGKPITIPGTDYTAQPTGIINQAQTKVQKTFGQETLDKIISGQKVDFSNPIELASLAGFGASVIATGGAGGLKTIPSKIIEALRSPQLAKATATKGLEQTIKFELPNTKTSNTLSNLEPSQVRSTSKIGSGGMSSSSSIDFTKGGILSVTSKDVSFTPSQTTGIFGSTKTIGQGTTGVFKSDLENKLTTSTPDVRNQKLEYISGGGKNEKSGSSGGKTGTRFSSKSFTTNQGNVQQLTRQERLVRETVKPTNPKGRPTNITEVKPVSSLNILSTRTKQVTSSKQLTINDNKIKQKQSTIIIPASIKEKTRVKTENPINDTKNKIGTNTMSKTSSKQKTKTSMAIITKTKQVTQNTSIPNVIKTKNNETNIPDKKRNLFGGLPGFNPLSGGLGKVSKGGNRLGYTGNVPITSIVGVYKRSEISYGNVKTPKSSAPKPKNLSKGNKLRL